MSSQKWKSIMTVTMADKDSYKCKEHTNTHLVRQLIDKVSGERGMEHQKLVETSSVFPSEFIPSNRNLRTFLSALNVSLDSSSILGYNDFSTC